MAVILTTNSFYTCNFLHSAGEPLPDICNKNHLWSDLITSKSFVYYKPLCFRMWVHIYQSLSTKLLPFYFTFNLLFIHIFSLWIFSVQISIKHGMRFYSILQGFHWPGKPRKLLEFCQSGKLLEFYVRPGIFVMISWFTLVLTL